MTEHPHAVAAVTIDPLVDLASFRTASGRPVVVSWCDGERQLEALELRQRIEGTGAMAACFGSDVPLTLALAVAQQLDESADPTGVVLLRAPTPDLWQRAARAGIRVLLPPDASPDDIRAAVREEAARVARVRTVREVSGPGQGHVIVVLSPKGGSGKTMVATNLAVSLASAVNEQVTLVDLDCVFGDVSSVLGLVPERTIGQLAMLPTFDSTLLKVFLTQHATSGLHILAGSGLPEEGEAVTPEIASHILTTLSKDVGYVVVDTAAGLDERALAAVDNATDLVFVASLDVASIRNLGKEMDALDRLGLNSARRHFVLNRADARVGLEVADVEAAIGMKADTTLPSSRSVPLSMNQGKPLVQIEPDSPVAKQLVSLAQRFVPAESIVVAPADARRRLIRKRTP